ncbi:MntP/YtaF family protein [Paenibacillus apiarius]|uniref:MntP/YtaF family protein n=1 Tax=Paenibacillus apiarius TaxID=46240 RepID=A0ABT4DWS8_9BACL|nr:MntP/YtaF family protein [Paenibacillus apiarius]MCY9515361.1 MntP/YtaF family protein [Paenibacillus apiarius]MCY9521817.1 MntP/YtaF family protein [Paenibacillus apiarius]MCY9550210.1 MntP/YtaF family protein [Paenibacillus apiarius]MCY9559486.1 MntP/YtaF family protein [Paenibacillus apiarius]MCY9686896.1 MntP/YtaF family protein [Paenibacillus apiarius]
MLIQVASMLVLAFALSLDSFGVGMTYGLRKLRIPWTSVIIISLCSGLVILVSMQVGSFLVQYVSAAAAQWIGSVILIGIGCWAIAQLLRSPADDSAVISSIACKEGSGAAWGAMGQGRPEQSAEPEPVFRIQLRSLGLVIQILRTPSAADMDRSGTISSSEAAWLGVALSLDAFGAGIGAALLGYPPLATALIIALFSGTFLRIGLQVGIACAHFRWIGKLTFIPGLMLIMMGIIKLFS